MTQPVIQVSGLEHTWLRGTPFAAKVLHGVDLQVNAGELIGLVGPSQAGKSTLALFLNGLLKTSPGHVRVAGVDTGARDADLLGLRRRIGLVFQYAEHQLFAQTVGEDVAFGPQAHGVDEAEVRQRVAAALGAVGLPATEFAQRSIHALSGGQKRRAAIAGVLALQPQILVLDDPIAGLDPRGRNELLALIARLHRDQGLTVVLVSNSVAEIAPLLQRVVVLHDGRVAADGAPGDVLTDLALLERVSLRPPPTTRLLLALRARGVDVPVGVLTPAGAAEAIAAALPGLVTDRSARGTG